MRQAALTLPGGNGGPRRRSLLGAGDRQDYCPRDQSVAHVEIVKDAAPVDEIRAEISNKMSLDTSDYAMMLKCPVAKVTKRTIYRYAKKPQLSVRVTLGHSVKGTT